MTDLSANPPAASTSLAPRTAAWLLDRTEALCRADTKIGRAHV